MEAILYNQEGKESNKILLPEEIFNLPVDESLIQEVVILQMANRRKMIAYAKDRSEVRGGGRKPWRQKGTGRARHGSRRSPLWRGGGVTFGPLKNKVYKKKINKKIKRKALFMVLSAKAKNNLLIFLDKIKLEKIKTKALNDILKKMPYQASSSAVKVKDKDKKKTALKEKEKKCLLVLSSIDEKLLLSAKNIANLEVMQAQDLNALDLLRFKYLIMTKEAVKAIKDNFLKK